MIRKRPPIRPKDLELLGASASLSQAQHIAVLPVAELTPGRHQPRRTFDDAALTALAQSLQEQGVLQPLLIRPVEGGHEIVAGERRWRAAQIAGLTEVPVIVRTLTDEEARAAALIENLQRENLNVIDEVDAKLDLVALALGLDREGARARLLELRAQQAGADHETLTRLFTPLSETWESFAKNKLRILGWPEAVLCAMRDQGLPFTHAGVIAAAPAEHHSALLQLAGGGASRAELQAEVARLKAKAAQAPAPYMQRALEVSRRLGSRRLLGSLKPLEARALERWLDKMPESVRQLLEGAEGTEK
ncbi:ParB/RepB/Spo0J family partition protein [Deinococcus hopiensis]|uniref:Chromosome partitioning protein, ParB family n=1 Tax=Deinococcus hopiensis KR-140 TaxID=695939 RepID=A0A1W1VWQ7_9DEIO|nr:ParB/RepB/Spo0J family partition protein [Deinococcus hopiensis]SMB97766.1 chromosome partitioning protein, ParB family [Deinococcus hopiensis KR-140]